MTFFAWFEIVATALALLFGPFGFGKTYTYGPGRYVVRTLSSIPCIAMAGRILGWW